MKQVRLPAKLTIGFDGDGNLVRFDVKYRAEYTEYPEIPEQTIKFTPTLTSEQEEQIKSFCKNVILPQIK